MSDIRALILDFGGVLTYPQADDIVQAMAERVGVSKEFFLQAHWRHRPTYDAGLSGLDYWRHILTELRRNTGADSLVPWLIEQDGTSWTRYREETWELARAFRATGGRTALLSNGVREITTRLRSDRVLNNWFDVIVVSCEVGLSKPDRRIYELCLGRLGVPGHEVLFVDDRRANVEGARQAGLRRSASLGTRTSNPSGRGCSGFGISKASGLLAKGQDRRQRMWKNVGTISSSLRRG